MIRLIIVCGEVLTIKYYNVIKVINIILLIWPLLILSYVRYGNRKYAGNETLSWKIRTSSEVRVDIQMTTKSNATKQQTFSADAIQSNNDFSLSSWKGYQCKYSFTTKKYLEYIYKS